MAMFSWIGSRRFWRVVLWIIHVLVVVAIVILLEWLNREWRLELALLSPFPKLHRVWLPLLFLLLYGGVWLGWWFFRLLRERFANEFPDITDAWSEAVSRLSASGINVKDAPLFLVVGRPTCSFEDFFGASSLPFAVRHEPRRVDSPLHVYASREAIYVTCEGASLLGAHAEILNHESQNELPLPIVPDPPSSIAASSTAPAIDALPEASAPTRVEPLAAERKVSGHERLLSPGKAKEVGVTANIDLVRLQSARLRYLCRLISRERRPFCSANGLLWLVPLAGTDTTERADESAAVCRIDHEAAMAGLQVHCPSAMIVCGLERLAGFRDMLLRLPDESRRQRLFGRSFPLAPDAPSSETGTMLRSGVDWLAGDLTPSLVYPCFELDHSSRLLDGNVHLWQLLAVLREKRDAISRVASMGLAGRSDQPPMLRGCYLAATGADADQQAFIGGVLRQLVVDQNHVAWTAAAMAEEADFRRMTFIGYTTMWVVVIALCVIGFISMST